MPKQSILSRRLSSVPTFLRRGDLTCCWYTPPQAQQLSIRGTRGVGKIARVCCVEFQLLSALRWGERFRWEREREKEEWKEEILSKNMEEFSVGRHLENGGMWKVFW